MWMCVHVDVFSSCRSLKKSTVFCIWIRAESWLLWSTRLSRFDISGKGMSHAPDGSIPLSPIEESGCQMGTVSVVKCQRLLEYNWYLCSIKRRLLSEVSQKRKGGRRRGGRKEGRGERERLRKRKIEIDSSPERGVAWCHCPPQYCPYSFSTLLGPVVSGTMGRS